jgi:large subunit ribosomal protein L13
MIVDGQGLVLGRLASFVAKKALEGETVDVVNADKVVISGDRKIVFQKYKAKAELGNPYHGVFLPKMPDRFVKRTIRGMIPYKKERGATAYRRVKCHIGVPAHLKGKDTKTIASANMEKFKTMKFVSVKDVCEYMKGSK